MINGSTRVDDISNLLDHAIDQYVNVYEIPMSGIVVAVAEYEPRRRKNS